MTLGKGWVARLAEAIIAKVEENGEGTVDTVWWKAGLVHTGMLINVYICEVGMLHSLLTRRFLPL